MSLVTRCPKCKSAFQVVLDQLRIHDGLVRCGHCSHVFDGYAGLETDLPTLTRVADPKPSGLHHASLAPDMGTVATRPDVMPLSSQALSSGEVWQEGALVPEGRPVGLAPTGASREKTPLEETPPEEIPPVVIRHRAADELNEVQLLRTAPVADSLDEPLINPASATWADKPSAAAQQSYRPDFLHEDDEPPALVARILWALAIFAALALLVVQLLFVYRNDIALAFPAVRPVFKTVCDRVGCEVGYSRRLERITIEASLTAVPGAVQDAQTSSLNLRLTMRNRYDQPQLWPSLIVSLSDASGTVVVRKTVAPYQYLPSTLLDQPFAAGQEVNLVLPLSITGFQITGFEIKPFFP
jgi:predicted Zn finger-like uncharacterized protein